MAHVLVVDDEPSMRNVLRRFIEAEGHEVHEAANGAQALAALQQHDIPVAFIDMIMPVMDGIGLLRRMRERFPDVAVIAMSAATEVLDLPAREMSLKHVLEKPFTHEEVRAALASALE